MFVGVVYRAKRGDVMPGVFRNPIESDTTAFAQIALFVPQPRLVWGAFHGSSQVECGRSSGGGIPG